jgi:hypothetical protein
VNERRSRFIESKKLHLSKRGEQIMEYTQSLAIWMAMSILASIRERGASLEANRSQPEEGFVPFRLPLAQPQLRAEAQPAVVGAASEALSIVG